MKYTPELKEHTEQCVEDCLPLANVHVKALLAEITRLQPLAELGQAVMDMPSPSDLQRGVYPGTWTIMVYLPDYSRVTHTCDNPLAALQAAKENN